MDICGYWILIYYIIYESIYLVWRVILFFQWRFAVQYWVCIKFHVSADRIIYICRKIVKQQQIITNGVREGTIEKNYFLAEYNGFLFFYYFLFSSSSFELYLIHTHARCIPVYSIACRYLRSFCIIILLYYLPSPSPVVSFVREPKAKAMTTLIAARTACGGARVHP